MKFLTYYKIKNYMKNNFMYEKVYKKMAHATKIATICRLSWEILKIMPL